VLVLVLVFLVLFAGTGVFFGAVFLFFWCWCFFRCGVFYFSGAGVFLGLVFLISPVFFLHQYIFETPEQKSCFWLVYSVKKSLYKPMKNFAYLFKSKF
jgi:hypothetical protein